MAPSVKQSGQEIVSPKVVNEVKRGHRRRLRRVGQ